MTQSTPDAIASRKGGRWVACISAHGEVVGKDRRGAAEHDDAPALVVGGDEQPAPERALERLEEPEESCGALEVPPVENESRGACVFEETDVLVTERRPRQAEHQSLAEEVLEVGHTVIVIPPCHSADTPRSDIGSNPLNSRAR